MLTPKISGIFDCRKYDQSGKKSHDQREMLGDGENVTFSALFPIDDVPECFKVNGQIDPLAKPRASKKERQAAEAEKRQAVCDCIAVKFKIGSNCKWFDKYAHPCDRPTNGELDSNRYNVQIDFTRKEQDASNPLAPSGYWVNAIMISKVENNPFAGQAFEDNGELDPEPNDGNLAEIPSNTSGDDLPFGE